MLKPTPLFWGRFGVSWDGDDDTRKSAKSNRRPEAYGNDLLRFMWLSEVRNLPVLDKPKIKAGDVLRFPYPRLAHLTR